MNIKDLKYYQKLVEYKNFSQVAEFFNTRQPTISMAIKRLENEFGVALFIRDHAHKTLNLTKAGEQLANHINVILNELQVAKEEIARSEASQIRFGLPPIIGNYYFPSLTPSLMRAKLMHSLDVYEHGSRELLKMLTKGQLDIALLGSLETFHEERLTTQEFANYSFKIIVGKNHPLAGKGAVRFADLAKESFIMPSSEFFHVQAFKQMCHQTHTRPKVIFQTPDIHVIKAMVEDNLGISFLTDLAIKPSDQLVALTLLDAQQPHFKLSLARRSTEVLSENEQKLWELLKHK
ncbi:MAG: LysR family transcriptional regulator [Limosilactobacillus sp.]|uniref:LysR family transcriptional regulator n=1 Tax=Limosilactobacillus sp. TaxID=2773925 RepID=UPI00271107D5|nr:LysR family transcriptional regulator [Limosilactobacillus sp.]